MSVSNYGENLLLGALPEKPYIKLHKGDPGEEGTANAAAETTRKQVTLAAASGGTRKSSTAAEWTGLAAKEIATHWSLWDAATLGNCLWTGAFSEEEPLDAGGSLTIKSGDFEVSLD
jgi:hypothetical protein